MSIILALSAADHAGATAPRRPLKDCEAVTFTNEMYDDYLAKLSALIRNKPRVIVTSFTRGITSSVIFGDFHVARLMFIAFVKVWFENPQVMVDQETKAFFQDVGLKLNTLTLEFEVLDYRGEMLLQDIGAHPHLSRLLSDAMEITEQP